MKPQSRMSILIALVIWAFGISCQTIMNLSPFPTPIPPIVQKTAKAENDGMTMVFVAVGTFIMGSNDGEPNERPVHTVYLDSYWIDQTEVTNKMYRLCMDDGPCEPPLADGFIAPKDHYTNPARINFPVTYVSWENARTYCEWAGRRLPIEAEWEKAARGSDGRMYPWGNQEPNAELLNFNNNNGGLTKVGSFPLGASPYGALDMAGNVWEFVAEMFNDDEVVTRGGAYFHGAYEVRTTMRSFVGSTTYNRSADIGFRCAADASVSSQGRNSWQEFTNALKEWQ